MKWRFASILATLHVLISTGGVSSTGAHSFVYQKDMSEYCRRQVVTSVFLGRRVKEANSQILHFSQLEVPYSCGISIRAEPGSNIVLVLEMKNVTEACELDSKGKMKSQVKVYELGETFGGYWGQLPEEMVRSTAPTNRRYYTLETTVPGTTMDSSYEYDDEPGVLSSSDDDGETEKLTDRDRSDPGANYMSVELPLLNVSGVLVESNSTPEKSFEKDDLFDVVNDVAPKPGQQYSSTTIPLVEFSVYLEDDTDYRRLGTNRNISYKIQEANGQGNYTDENIAVTDDPRYALDYEVFTPDARLKYPFLAGILTGNEHKFHRGQKFNANKILKFRKQKEPFFRRRNQPPAKYPDNTILKDSFHSSEDFSNDAFYKPTKKALTSEVHANNAFDAANSGKPETSKDIDELIKVLNQSREGHDFQRDNNSVDEIQTLKKIANMHHNYSAYLAPNLSIYNNLPTSFEVQETGRKIENATTVSREIPHIQKSHGKTRDTTFKSLIASSSSGTDIHTATTKQIESGTKRDDQNSTPSLTTQSAPNYTGKIAASDRGNIFRGASTRAAAKLPKQKKQPSTSTTKPNESIPIHLVNHESWENIVQAAPAIAKVLDKSTPVQNKSGHRKKRRKRLIQAIDIEKARPHNITLRVETVTTPEDMYVFTDRQDFAQLVEVEDDEVNGRVALRFMSRYVGNLLFDVCKIPYQKSRQVFLFNTSRILLAINDLTVKRMTLVVTPARILSTSESRCPDEHLECQVSGARVCIDSMCACDGVPNCGSYDVYDEDRLRCSMDRSAQHSVYLAAFAFLAVLFTALYTVYYWLKRCVPKVSDAFFIYTDGTENILYLDSIMRSPTVENDNDTIYNSNIFGDELIEQLQTEDSKIKELSAMEKFKNFVCCFRKKRPKEVESFDRFNFDVLTAVNRRQKIYSYAEGEITNIPTHMVDDTTQTGESLEMQFVQELVDKKLSQKRVDNFYKDTKRVDAFPATTDKVEQSRDSELSMLKFMKDARTSGNQKYHAPTAPEETTRQHTRSIAVGDERELQNTFYDSKINLHHIGSFSSDNPEMSSFTNTGPMKPCTSSQARKHLRFNDNLKTIPSEDADQDTADLGAKKKRSAYTTLGAAGRLSDVAEDEVQEYSAARDFKRFWSSNKGNKKTNKKKNQSSLR